MYNLMIYAIKGGGHINLISKNSFYTISEAFTKVVNSMLAYTFSQ